MSIDLNYMVKFFVENKRQNILYQEVIFMEKLRMIAYPCCRNEGQPLSIYGNDIGE